METAAASILYVGLDVHKESIDIATADEGRDGEVRHIGRIGGDLAALDKALRRLIARGHRLHVVYEAGPCGFVIWRHLTARGISCEVVAPSSIPRAPGERIKTDRRDALLLARLARSGDLKAVRVAKRVGIQLKQTHEREGKTLRRRAGGYAHAKQFKRLRSVLKRQRTILGRLLREVRRKMTGLADENRTTLDTWVQRAERIHRQRPKDKNKLYALHAPEPGVDVVVQQHGLLRAHPLEIHEGKLLPPGWAFAGANGGRPA